MDEIALREKKKYELLWSRSSYRECSLGEMLFPHFWDHFHKQIQAGDLVIDFGCGCGRVAKEFLQRELNVLLLDLCSNCLDEEVAALCALFCDRMQFQEACLWDLPNIQKASWIYCCDVLEHIPESLVDKVLENMSEACIKGGYLSICLQEDLTGKNIGQPLHLTVKDKSWWQDKVLRYFIIEKDISFVEGVYFNCCVRKRGQNLAPL